jgi:hypothetical protein
MANNRSTAIQWIFLCPLAMSEENQPRRGRYGLAGLLSVAGLALIASIMLAVLHFVTACTFTIGIQTFGGASATPAAQ